MQGRLEATQRLHRFYSFKARCEMKELWYQGPFVLALSSCSASWELGDKVRYVAHTEDLKLWEELGLEITEVHRGITFDESAWMQPYSDLKTKLRAKATNELEKDFFKLMNNSVFGKTLENPIKRVIFAW